MSNKSTKKQINNKNSHDVFVKKAMSDKNVAREFFEVNLPQDILSQVDLSTLNQEKENYFDNTSTLSHLKFRDKFRKICNYKES